MVHFSQSFECSAENHVADGYEDYDDSVWCTAWIKGYFVGVTGKYLDELKPEDWVRDLCDILSEDDEDDFSAAATIRIEGWVSSRYLPDDEIYNQLHSDVPKFFDVSYPIEIVECDFSYDH